MNNTPIEQEEELAFILYICNEDGSRLGIMLDPTKHFTHAHPEDIINKLGLIPSFLANPETMHLPFRECINTNYAHGGGWKPFEGFMIHQCGTLTYPDDPTLYPLVKYFRYGNDWEAPEHIYQYEHDWVCIHDDKPEVARLD
jgi:hypothetical protein